MSRIVSPFRRRPSDPRRGALRRAGIGALGAVLSAMRPGADKLALPRVRIDYGMGIESFAEAVG